MDHDIEAGIFGPSVNVMRLPSVLPEQDIKLTT